MILILIIISPIIYICFGNVATSLKHGSTSYFRKMALTPANTSPYIKYLRTIRDDPSTLNYVVYIPRGEINFWGSMSCRHSSYFIPAISERPALYAWPDVNCYSYQCGPRFHSYDYCEKSQKFYTDDELLKEARRLGFYGVIFIEYEGMRFLN